MSLLPGTDVTEHPGEQRGWHLLEKFKIKVLEDGEGALEAASRSLPTSFWQFVAILSNVSLPTSAFILLQGSCVFLPLQISPLSGHKSY